jgi:hypothetical protein
MHQLLGRHDPRQPTVVMQIGMEFVVDEGNLYSQLELLKETVTRAWAATLFSFCLLGKASSGTMAILYELVKLRRGGTATTFDQICTQSQMSQFLEGPQLLQKCIDFYYFATTAPAN